VRQAVSVRRHTFDKDKDAKPVYHRKVRWLRRMWHGLPLGALHLEPVPEEEWFHVPSSFVEWEEARIRQMEAEQAEA